MAEIAPSGGGPNRLFIVIAIGLGALLFLGLIGLGGFLVFQNISRPAASPTARALAVTPTVIRVIASPAAPATDVPTPTLVLIAAASPTAGASATQSLVTATIAVTTTGTITGSITGTGTPQGPLPQTGVGEDLLLLAAGLVLVLVIFAARRARASRPA